MSKVADSIRRGLQEALAYADGTAAPRAYQAHIPATINVKATRAKLAMTQEEFAGRFGFSVSTLRHWEQGTRQPEGPTRAYFFDAETQFLIATGFRPLLRYTIYDINNLYQ